MAEGGQEPSIPAWLRLADVLVQVQAVIHRVARGAPADDLAGLRIDDGEIDALLDELTNRSASTEAIAAASQLAPAVEEARQAFVDSLNEPSPFSTLVANAQLSVEEAEILAVAAAIELDPRRQRLLAYVQDDVTKVRLTLDGIRKLFSSEHPGVLAVGTDSGLTRSALLEVNQDGPWSAHTIVVHPMTIWALVGDSSPDPGLPLGWTTHAIDDDLADGATVVVVTGDDRIRRREVAAETTQGTRFVVSPPPADEAGWASLTREATITGAGVIVELEDGLPEAGRRWIGRAEHCAWALTSRHELPLATLPDRPWIEHLATADEVTDDEWIEAFGDIPRSHRLTAEQLSQARLAFSAQQGDIDAAVRRLASGQLDRLAQRRRPTRGWDDLVLPRDRIDHLHELVSRYRNSHQVYDEWGFSAQPSRGVVALFSGPSGTGKTLSAEIIAGELGLDLFKLELSAIVSKYIGETEKNLEEVFAAAGAGNLVLFFDEADALFGKRSEVKDARDRYANIEVSYLLQRLEAYDGLVILASNFEKNIDDAFLRRIHFKIDFGIPDDAERLAIWQGCFPEEAPLKDADLEFLAHRFELSGGAIRNASLYAAFLAAEAQQPITMDVIVLGLRREYQKLGRLLKQDDFGPYHALVST